MSHLDQSDSERAVLGACMSVENPHAFLDAALLIQGEDFFRPQHATIWDAIAQLHIDGIPADPVILADRLADRLPRLGGVPYLAELYQRACPSVAIPHHAQLIADAATSRRLVAVGKSIAQRAETTDTDPAELVRWAGEQVATARDQRVGVDVLTRPYDQFATSVPEVRPMVIPGMLGVGDRLILTGSGGLGKSAMLSQIAVCAAAGIQPFDWHCEDTYEPQKVTILDFENPDHRVKTRLWPMVRECADIGSDPRPNLTIGGGGNPLDVLNPHNSMSLLRTIEHDKPTLVLVGPLYKMHKGDPDKETDMKKVADVLDSIRAMGVAILTEAHHTKAGKSGGTLEPSGANLWTWWPEFGFGLRLQDGDLSRTMRRCDLDRWRIDRETAAWPDEVEASGKLGLAWARADSRTLARAS